MRSFQAVRCPIRCRPWCIGLALGAVLVAVPSTLAQSSSESAEKPSSLDSLQQLPTQPSSEPADVPAPEENPDKVPAELTLPLAIRWAIAHNPALATARKNHGVAAAGIVIANTYPFNPIVQDYVWGDGGPTAAGITNRVFNEHTVRLDWEYRGQGKIRRNIARAVLSRTDWEIANQEVLVGIQVVRTFQTALYRREKVRVLEQTARLQEEVFGQVERLVAEGALPSSELVLARADVAEAQAAVAPAVNLLTVAENDLRRQLGVIDCNFTVQGTLETLLPEAEACQLVSAAEERRPDLHALSMAVQEAAGRIQLEIANRLGNPSLGPAVEYNETSVTFVGLWAIWQIPILNTRKGDIMQRRAEHARAMQAFQSAQVTMRQDVWTALNRLHAAEKTVDLFRTQTIPELRTARADLDKLFASGQAGVTLGRIVGLRLRLLNAYNLYLDGLFELALSEADLAAAVGDPTVALLPPRPEPAEEAPQPRKAGE
jgi:outer membrane protein TolC